MAKMAAATTRHWLLAVSANILVATILGFTIDAGFRFVSTVHVDGKSPPDVLQYCQFIGFCRSVDIEHCFFSAQAMTIVLAVGSIMVLEFALWAFAQCFAFSSARDGTMQGQPPPSSGVSSTLLTATLYVVGCASTLALFAPHKTTFEVQNPVASFPTTQYAGVAHLNALESHPWLRTDEVVNSLLEFYVQSAGNMDEAFSTAMKSTVVEDEAAVYQRYAESVKQPMTVRVGDTMFPSIRTLGIGVNMASFGDYFLSEYGRNSSLGSYQRKGQEWLVAPDYKLQSLRATVYGTNVSARCQDVTDSFTIRYSTGELVLDEQRGEVAAPLPDEPFFRLNGFERFDFTSSNLTKSVIHQYQQRRRLTPVLPRPSLFGVENMSTAVHFIITDTELSSPHPRSKKWDATVLRCDYEGHEILADVSFSGAGGALLVERVERGRELGHAELLTASYLGIYPVLQNSPRLHSLLNQVRGKNYWNLYNGVSSTLRGWDQLLIEDTLTDLAQAYWTLVRQQLETAVGAGAFMGIPQAGQEMERGQLKGTYTRVGGAAWGLIFPVLLAILPAFATSHLVFSMVRTMVTNWPARAGVWRRVPQSDEDEEVYLPDEVYLPPLPPPKDDDDVPPPPYSARSDGSQS
ncbi:hypothetical protein JX265_000880 [Neoarthrinium moseri]|uniref:Transmembrane protein n=1 Tax=Neoarthrinium moseri TaxID=1658444 RepID=A0A9P9WWS0_9PEZI|nr:hypothetical protein JX265_000880 [Neoarthrinium moseri]